MKKVLERLFCVCAIAFTFMLLNAIPARAAKGDFDSIQIGTSPDKLFYNVGEVFNPKGMEVEALFDDGKGDFDVVDLTDYTFSPSGPLTLNDNKITISYTVNGVTRTTVQYIGFYVPESICFIYAPTKVYYGEGEKFDPKGMKIGVAYRSWKEVGKPDEDGADVTDKVTWEPSGPLTYNESTLGYTVINFSYTENGTTVTTEHTVNVIPPGEFLKGLEIKTPPDRVIYNEGEYFNLKGMVLKATYADGSTKEIGGYGSGISIDLNRILWVSDTQVTISYTERGIQKTVILPINVYPRIQSTLNVVWDDNNNRYGLRPEKLDVFLRDTEKNSLHYELSEASGWSRTQHNMEQYLNNRKVNYYWDYPRVENYEITDKVIEDNVTTVTYRVIPPADITKTPEPGTGLVYNGEEQALVSEGEADGGIFCYAVTGRGEAEPDAGLYSTAVPRKKYPGSYDVYYFVKGGSGYSDTKPQKLEVEIGKAQYTGTRDVHKFVSSMTRSYNNEIDLPAVPEGASYSKSYGTVKGTADFILKVSIGTDKMTFNAADKPADTYVTLRLSVTGAVGYKDYDVLVTITASDKADAGVTITGGDRTVEYGESLTLAATASIPGKGMGVWTWECMDDIHNSGSAIADIDAGGKLTLKKPGVTTVRATYTSDTTTGTGAILLTVTQKGVTITKVTVLDKEYDGTTNAVIGSSGTVNGIVDGDEVSVAKGTAHYRKMDVGKKTVYFRGFSLAGKDAGKYRLVSQPEDTTANISKKTVTVNVTAVDREYMRGKTTVDLTGVTLNGIADRDWVLVDSSAMTCRMTDADAGMEKPVKVTGLKLKNPDAVNYVLRQPEGVKVNISKAALDKPAPLSLTYPYTDEIEDRLDLSALLPEDTGMLSFKAPVTDGNISFLEAPVVSEGVLSYKMKAGNEDRSSSVKITAQMQNYNDVDLTVNIKQTALAIYEKTGNKKYEICTSKNLNAGKSIVLVPMYADGINPNRRVIWSSSMPDVASVTQNGKITAICPGETVITAKSEEHPTLTATCHVSVSEPVTEVALDRTKCLVGTDETVILNATVLPFTARQKLQWTSDNKNVTIVVSKDTLSAAVTGKAAGKAKVTAAASDGSGRKAVCSFTIGGPVPAFTVSGKGNKTEVKAGKTLNMLINWDGGKPKNASVIWSVAAVEEGKDVSFIATISDKGVLTGITAGKVRVIAKSAADPERSSNTVITVAAPDSTGGADVRGIELTNKDTLKKNGLKAGRSYTLRTKLMVSGKGKAASNAIAWISSDEKVATVSQKGVIKAVGSGEVTITAVKTNMTDMDNTPRDSVTFTVVSIIKRVKTDRNKLIVGTAGKSIYGKVGIAQILPEDATNPEIEWKSSNDNVKLAAVVNGMAPSSGSFVDAVGSGLSGTKNAKGIGVIVGKDQYLAVMAVTPGTVKLTGITKDGSNKKVTCKVTVRGQVTGLSFKDSSVSIKAGSSMTLKPIIEINGVSGSSTDKADKTRYNNYKKYSDTSVSYRSSNVSVITVNAGGKISVKKGVPEGTTTTVYAESSDGKCSAKITIIVK